MTPVGLLSFRRRVDRSQGFTVVEVVVALAVLSLIMLATVSGLRTLGNTQTSINRTTERVAEVRSVSTLLRDVLESSIAGSASDSLVFGSGGKIAGYFKLEDQGFVVKSNVMFGEGFGGHYFIRVARSGSQLTLSWQDPLILSKPQEWGGAPSKVLLDDLEEFRLSYRSSPNGPWRKDVEAADQVLGLKLQIKVAGRYWPELIMRAPVQQG